MIIYYTHNYSGSREESHEILKQALGDYLRDEEKASVLVDSMTTTGDNGKPVIEGFQPFSISHSKTSWAVLISDQECGLDIQYHRNCNMQQIAHRFYAHEDAEAVSGSHGEEMFFRLWARREALIKATGGSIASSDVPPVLSGEAIYDGRKWYLTDIRIPGADSMEAAICSENQCPDITFRELKVN